VYTGTIESYALSMVTQNRRKTSKGMIILKGSFGTANLYFEEERGASSENKKQEGADHFDLFFKEDDWPAMVDMLRNEGPTGFMFNEAEDVAAVFTGDELAGEGE
jgi:hypothetical protein